MNKLRGYGLKIIMEKHRCGPGGGDQGGKKQKCGTDQCVVLMNNGICKPDGHEVVLQTKREKKNTKKHRKAFGKNRSKKTGENTTRRD